MGRRIVRHIILVSLAAAVCAAALTACAFYLKSGGAEIDKGELAFTAVCAAALAFALGVFLAFKSAKAICEPIRKINLECPEEHGEYPELEPILSRISRQNAMLERQISDMREEHKREDAMRRDFTANVSHELKTPLTSISGYAELIKTGMAKEDDVPKFAGKIYDESQRLITLVGDIIKLSRLEDMEKGIEFEDVDLYDVCEAVFDRLEIASREKNVTMSLHGEHTVIRAVEGIVNEIVFNLCDNAVKYNRYGGRVDVAIKQFADGVELSVRDTGIGIPQEDIARIFERFYRVDKSHSKAIGGTGLGLSIVKHGVKSIGAHIDVQSEVDKGTTVRILF